MEDISKELEKEIAEIKPSPYKMSRENSILIINNLGEIRSGDFLKTLVCFFLAISLMGGLGTIVFCRLYAKANKQKIQLQSSRDVLEKKVDRLTGEKEILMARLVVTGNTAELETLTNSGKIDPDPSKTEKGNPDNLPPDKKPGSKKNKDKRAGRKNKESASSRSRTGDAKESAEPFPGTLSHVSVGAFSLSRDGADQGLIVAFNIKNSPQNSKELSGRIFCVLKPKDAVHDKWVVVPNASIMKNGLPGPYKQGHFFSISRFIPIKFTVNIPASPQDFAEAGVFIFDETEKLIFKTTFDIGKNKQD